MTFALVSHVTNTVVGVNNTAAISTIGASFLGAIVDSTIADISNPTDSYGNSWGVATFVDDGANIAARLVYVINPTVGSMHTFNPNNAFGDICVGAWSGASGGGILINHNELGNTASGIGSFSAGSMFPLIANSLVLVGTANAWTGTMFPTGYSVTDLLDFSFSMPGRLGRALAWKEVPGLASIDPFWAFTGQTLNEQTAMIANFSPGTSGGFQPAWVVNTNQVNGGYVS